MTDWQKIVLGTAALAALILAILFVFMFPDPPKAYAPRIGSKSPVGARAGAKAGECLSVR